MNANRYHRQVLLPQIGAGGQERLSRARVLLVGCGALGSVIAEQLVRAGIGFLRLVDRDVVELSNLQRQVLFDEEDARQGLPKAVAAANRLGRINSAVSVDAIVADVHSGNIESLAGLERDERVNLILDGTDNVETRYLINDVSVKHHVPWVYGACVGTEGRVMTILPGQTPCLRCVFEEPPAPGELPGCDTAGVLGPVASMVASMQAVAGMKVLIGAADASEEKLISLDAWRGRYRSSETSGARRDDCPCCAMGRFVFLDARPAHGTTSLCGRHAVQVRPAKDRPVDVEQVFQRLDAVGTVERTPYLIRCRLFDPPGLNLTLFQDGRAIIQGTTDVDRARSLYARFIGA